MSLSNLGHALHFRLTFIMPCLVFPLKLIVAFFLERSIYCSAYIFQKIWDCRQFYRDRSWCFFELFVIYITPYKESDLKITRENNTTLYEFKDKRNYFNTRLMCQMLDIPLGAGECAGTRLIEYADKLFRGTSSDRYIVLSDRVVIVLYKTGEAAYRRINNDSRLYRIATEDDECYAKLDAGYNLMYLAPGIFLYFYENDSIFKILTALEKKGC